MLSQSYLYHFEPLQPLTLMHVAIGLKKRLVLFNNIFNPREFELYKRGKILEPVPPCECTFVAECDKHCMERIQPAHVIEAVRRQVAALK